MKKLLFLVVIGALAYGLYTHWDEALELGGVLRSRPYRNLSDKELMKQQFASQERVLQLYHQKDSIHEKGLKNLKGLDQALEMEGAIFTEQQALNDLEHERVIRKIVRGLEMALLVGLPGLIFIGLILRGIRRRSRGPFYAPLPAEQSPRRGWIPFRKKLAAAPVSPVRIGATQAEIFGRLGPPQQRTHFTESEAWSYRIPMPAPAQDGTPSFTHYRSLIVLFRNRKVFDVSWEDAGPDFDSIHID